MPKLAELERQVMSENWFSNLDEKSSMFFEADVSMCDFFLPFFLFGY
jgi:hypothetical protein